MGRVVQVVAAGLTLVASAAANCVVDHSFGCFVDGNPSPAHPNSSRLLRGPHVRYRKNTRSVCASWCHAQNYTVAGVEFRKQCFCDGLLHAARHPHRFAASIFALSNGVPPLSSSLPRSRPVVDASPRIVGSGVGL